MTLRNFSINLELGQEILVGPNNDVARITKIEYHDKSGELVINTTRGTRKVLTFKLAPSYNNIEYANPADKYR